MSERLLDAYHKCITRETWAGFSIPTAKDNELYFTYDGRVLTVIKLLTEHQLLVTLHNASAELETVLEFNLDLVFMLVMGFDKQYS